MENRVENFRLYLTLILIKEYDKLQNISYIYSIEQNLSHCTEQSYLLNV